MIKFLFILTLAVIAAYFVASLLRRGNRSKTSGGEEVDRHKLNRNNAIDVEYTEIPEETGDGKGG